MVYEPPEDVHICMLFTVAMWYWKLMCPTKVCVHMWDAQLPQTAAIQPALGFLLTASSCRLTQFWGIAAKAVLLSASVPTGCCVWCSTAVPPSLFVQLYCELNWATKWIEKILYVCLSLGAICNVTQWAFQIWEFMDWGRVGVILIWFKEWYGWMSGCTMNSVLFHLYLSNDIF